MSDGRIVVGDRVAVVRVPDDGFYGPESDPEWFAAGYEGTVVAVVDDPTWGPLAEVALGPTWGEVYPNSPAAGVFRVADLKRLEPS